MKIAVDTHTHTLVSGHAYNTIREMLQMAAEKGLEALAITDHGPKMYGGPHEYYFHNHRVIPREYCGIKLLFGAELNIMDTEGTVDLPDWVIGNLDIALASIHIQCYGESRGIADNTKAFINIMKRSDVDIIGHPDDGRFPIDYEELVETAKITGTLLEVNNSSMKPGGFRKNAYENDIKMLTLCKKAGVSIVLGSDAHVDTSIADTTYSSQAIKETEFPEELIANTSYEKLMRMLKRNQ